MSNVSNQTKCERATTISQHKEKLQDEVFENILMSRLFRKNSSQSKQAYNTHTNIHTILIILIHTMKYKLKLQQFSATNYTPSQPGWTFGFSNSPGLAAKGIPLKTSTDR